MGRASGRPGVNRSRRQPSFSLPLGLRLRPWVQADAAGLVLALRDPLVRHYAGFVVDDRTQALARVQRSASAWFDEVGAHWVIGAPEGGVLGSLGFGQLLSGVESGSVGYWLLPEARGHGVVTTAVRIATLAVFEHLGWRRIELYHAVENERSRFNSALGLTSQGFKDHCELRPAPVG